MVELVKPPTEEQLIELLKRKNDLIGGTCEIRYKEFLVRVPYEQVSRAMGILKNNMNEKPMVMAQVNQALWLRYNLMRAGKARQSTADEYVTDLCIWWANEIIEGRQELTRWVPPETSSSSI